MTRLPLGHTSYPTIGTDMANLPYPLRKSGSNSTFSDASYDINVGGTWYTGITTGLYSTQDADRLLKIPASAITTIAKWIQAQPTKPPNSGSGTPGWAETTWLQNPNDGSRTEIGIYGHPKIYDSARFTVLIDYAGYYDPSLNQDPTHIPNLGGVVTNPLGAITSVTDFLTRFWDALASWNTWRRILEVAAGLLILGVGIAELTGKDYVKGLTGIDMRTGGSGPIQTDPKAKSEYIGSHR